MITEFFLSIFAGVAEWFIGLFGTAAPPAWITDLTGFFTDLGARTAGLGAWIPWPVFGTVAMAVFGLWAGFWIVKGIRWFWGLTPFSGGS